MRTRTGLLEALYLFSFYALPLTELLLGLRFGLTELVFPA
nr:MAG TPA: hypothetical protein [Caudoviricetes sp.]